ncbi:hypothetical protein XELAEV_18040142mg [Xenopus laevis]|uniref:Uncharacterized protein n=1 Tax=Xenopus laevis TaxID=8355 RepID=A0A974H8M6_XENLA|nr:hypothetical protein XELAEV_18040142mg [Xenopus laevis]
MRAPDCFIQYSIIVSVLLYSSGLVMGRPIEPGMEILRLPRATDFQKTRIKTLQRLREILLDAVESVAKALKGAEIEFKSLPQNAAQEQEKIGSLQKIVKGVLDGVEFMVQIVKDLEITCLFALNHSEIFYISIVNYRKASLITPPFIFD